ncbi:uncharacterized protein LOC131180063 [Hevea brasiliensis]|uniref:uncharacterized protein LOC131180063 n=1 Tax=Hevea brasiliensis TaxID=3981 RepID=UPI0025E533AD|nr:uncharacterized protein LOC131180063 [Hevea brasiliensis]
MDEEVVNRDRNSATVECEATRNQGSGDLMSLLGSDHPGMILVSVPLIGSNFRSWCHAMKIALGAKQKLGFVDGSILELEEGSEGHEKWKRCDYMITSWILNSMSKELVEAFIYTASARELRNEIAESCGAAKELADIIDRNKLMQFLMGLDESFEQARNLIFLIDPLPSISKAYSTVIKFETHKQIASNFSELTGEVALFSKGQGIKKEQKKYDPKKGHCNYCNMDGHIRENCFKLVGYPDWWKSRNKNQPRQYKSAAAQVVKADQLFTNMNVVDTPLEACEDNHSIEDLSVRLGSIQQELQRLIKGKAFVAANVMGPDLQTEKVIAVAHKVVGLYKLDKSCFLASSINDCLLSLQNNFLISSPFDAMVKIIRTDNGVEFVNSNFAQLVSDRDIIHQRTCPYTPQQNGIVERKHRHLLDIARALRIQAQLPKEFWSECVLTATYIINRLLMQKFNWLTPYELLYHKLPDYSHMRVFGCLCYAVNLNPYKDKFDDRAIQSVFIGYSGVNKGYKLYSLKDKKICPLSTVTDITINDNDSHHSPPNSLPSLSSLPLSNDSSSLSLPSPHPPLRRSTRTE